MSTQLRKKHNVVCRFPDPCPCVMDTGDGDESSVLNQSNLHRLTFES